MLILPPIDLPEEDIPQKYKFSIVLDGVTFNIYLQYMFRSDRWYISLSDALENPLVMGKKMVIDFSLFEYNIKSGMPKGQIVLFDTSGTGEECGFADLGNRCKLIYLEDSEDEPIPYKSYYDSTLTIDIP